VSYIPEANEISFDSIINILPRDNNYARELQSLLIRSRIEDLVKNFLEEV